MRAKSAAVVAMAVVCLSFAQAGAAQNQERYKIRFSTVPTGSLDLTPEQVQALHVGQLYIQISSEKAPEGNLWGWLLR